MPEVPNVAFFVPFWRMCHPCQCEGVAFLSQAPIGNACRLGCSRIEQFVAIGPDRSIEEAFFEAGSFFDARL